MPAANAGALNADELIICDATIKGQDTIPHANGAEGIKNSMRMNDMILDDRHQSTPPAISL